MTAFHPRHSPQFPHPAVSVELLSSMRFSISPADDLYCVVIGTVFKQAELLTNYVNQFTARVWSGGSEHGLQCL
jgi:hypothetical protein